MLLKTKTSEIEIACALLDPIAAVPATDSAVASID
jgi:hypothetical protein